MRGGLAFPHWLCLPLLGIEGDIWGRILFAAAPRGVFRQAFSVCEKNKWVRRSVATSSFRGGGCHTMVKPDYFLGMSCE